MKAEVDTMVEAVAVAEAEVEAAALLHLQSV